MTSFLRPPKKAPPASFTGAIALTLAPGRLEGRPVVVISFGRRHGELVLDADDVDRFVAGLEANLRAARELGEK